MVAPDLGEQALAADDLALMPHEMVQEPELAVGELGHHVAEPRLPPRQVERQRPGRDDVPSPPQWPRRSCARIRASSSSNEKGLET